MKAKLFDALKRNAIAIYLTGILVTFIACLTMKWFPVPSVAVAGGILSAIGTTIVMTAAWVVLPDTYSMPRCAVNMLHSILLQAGIVLCISNTDLYTNVAGNIAIGLSIITGVVCISWTRLFPNKSE